MNLIIDGNNLVLRFSDTPIDVRDGVYVTNGVGFGIRVGSGTVVTNAPNPEYVLNECYFYKNGTYEIADQEIYEQRKASLAKSLEIPIRAQRDALLQASDWTQVGDLPDSFKAPWAVYRQQLRDLSLQPNFPFEIQFPEQPTVKVSANTAVQGTQEF
jgi:hypothetical protein